MFRPGFPASQVRPADGHSQPSDFLSACPESVNDEMAEAIAASQPLRSVVSFGIMSPEELAAEIEKYK